MSDELELLPEEPTRRDDMAAHPLYGGAPLDAAEPLPSGERCANHPKSKANGTCSACKRPVCGQCRILSQGKVLCLECRRSQGWSPPVTLRLAIALGWATVALSASYRALHERPTAPEAPLLPDGFLGLPPSVTAITRWGSITEFTSGWVGHGQLLAVGVVLIALAHSRSSEAQTGRMAWRVALACLLGGTAIVLAADAPFALLVRALS